jgi:ubiquinone/menaquinone biosynthesis C-methylase UbiE
MSPAKPSRLSAADIARLDPYALLAVLGKRVIHPGGRASTEALLLHAACQSGAQVLDVGCGVGTTAIALAQRFSAQVTAVDISPLMLERARSRVHAAGVADLVTVEQGDILALRFSEHGFDVVLAEAVTMFVDRLPAARELVRVCRPGGCVLATEFLWRRPPSDDARRIFLGEVCPGMSFDTAEEWVSIYRQAGLEEVKITTGPFAMMTPRGFIRDEGAVNSLRVMGRALSRPAYLRKMAWLMPRMQRAVPYLGYAAIAGRKPL